MSRLPLVIFDGPCGWPDPPLLPRYRRNNRSSYRVARAPTPRKVSPRAAALRFYAGELSPVTSSAAMFAVAPQKKFIDAPEGRNALGMVFDRQHDLLFVAGRTGQGYVYNTRSRTTVRPTNSGCRVLADRRCDTDSSWRLVHRLAKPQLYFVPLSKKGTPAATLGRFSCPDRCSADWAVQPQWNSRRGWRAHPDRRAHGEWRSVHGESENGRQRALGGISVPNVDGIGGPAGHYGRYRTRATRSRVSASTTI